jgi:hypothetical protein
MGSSILSRMFSVPLRDRVEAVLREVDLHAAQCAIREHRQRDEEHGEHRQRGNA